MVGGGGDCARARLLDYEVKCEKDEVLVVVRPYMRLLEPQTSEGIEVVSRTGLTFNAIGTDLLSDSPMRLHLAGLDGFGVQRMPFSFEGRVPEGMKLSAHHIGAIENTWGQEAKTEEFGVALENGARLTADWTGIGILPRKEAEHSFAPDSTFKVVFGVLGAIYTTKQ